ncbi:NUDIX domain-containing protein [Shimia gijangensis]|uniref:NUDIX domain-containing protein n=1 Tax=Shimia gijangensis TaxID=1470563 RepID=UPI002ADE2EE1|nr:NUDIX domain-containing protein [Shimia gijangensis]
MFFYGTLRYVPLLAIVLGRAAKKLNICEAQLENHTVSWAKNQVFPMISAGGDGAKGILVSGLSDSDIARLNYYEGGFDYDLKPVLVSANGLDVETEVYFPNPDLWQIGEDWSLEKWIADWGEMTLFAAREVMSYFGQYSAEKIATMFPMIRARATAKVNARMHNLGSSPSGFSDRDVQVHAMVRPYVDFFTMNEFDLSFRRYDGGQSDMVRRAVFIATDAVIVLPYDPVRDRVLLIEQFRPGPFARGDKLPWQLEPIAGRVDAGEHPEDTAHRESEEEAGLTLQSLHEVAHCYASPGCSTEYYNIYIGLADLPDTVAGVAGLDSEAEDIKSYLFSFDELMGLVDNMQAVNAPLVLAGLWLARHRERLRGNA